LRAVEGGRVVVTGVGFPIDEASVSVGGAPARVLLARSTRIAVALPAGLEGGRTPIRLGGVPGETAFVDVGVPVATGIHQVDNPVVDRHGHLYVTYSGSRGQETPVSVFRVTPEGTREPFVSGIVNATSMTIGPDERLYVSSRFEGAVYRVESDGRHERIASELGVACGIAFDARGVLYVGDRSGTVFRVDGSKALPFASLPASIAAFHLAMAPSGDIFVSGPTLGTVDHLYRIDGAGQVHTLPIAFGRPQGLAFSPDGVLHVVDALAGSSGLFRLSEGQSQPELVVAAPSLVGVAFGSSGELVVASNDTAYRFGPQTEA
jgi:hypothetical protein